jgi:hypothetical protein
MHLAPEDLAGIEVKSDLEGLTGLYVFEVHPHLAPRL